MRALLRNEEGSALVAALFFIIALTLTATVVVWVTSGERRISFNDYAHARSFYASDAGTESAVNWLRFEVAQDFPPTPDTDDKVNIMADPEVMYNDHSFQFDIEQKQNASGTVGRHAPGFETGGTYRFIYVDYLVDSEGTSDVESSARIEVQAARLFIIQQ
jgi:hypothetical protein